MSGVWRWGRGFPRDFVGFARWHEVLAIGGWGIQLSLGIAQFLVCMFATGSAAYAVPVW